MIDIGGETSSTMCPSPFTRMEPEIGPNPIEGRVIEESSDGSKINTNLQGWGDQLIQTKC